MDPSGDTAADRFRRRVERQRRLYASSMNSLSDRELIDLAYGDDESTRELAMEILFQRIEAELRRRAAEICSHLSHCGAACTRPITCPHAFGSALQALVKATLGINAVAHYRAGDSRLVEVPTGRKERTTTPRCTARSWKSSNENGFVSAVRRSLALDGTMTECRRQWNKDRGLKVRFHLDKMSQHDVEQRRDNLPDPHFDSDVVAFLRSLQPGDDLARWLAAAYDDACENAAHSIVDIDITRVIRMAAGTAAGASGLAHDASTPEKLHFALLELIASTGRGSLLRDYFQPAWSTTRHIVVETVRDPDVVTRRSTTSRDDR